MSIYTNEDIVRYVEDEMSFEEKQKMEEDMRSDAALSESVALYRQVRETLEQRLPTDGDAAAFRRKLDAMRGKYFAGSGGNGTSGGDIDTGYPLGKNEPGGAKMVKMKMRFPRYIVGVAAAAAILFVVVILWPSDYLNGYGKTRMAGVAERGEGNDTVMERASEYFNAEQFEKALPLLDQVYHMDSTDQTALFYRGVAKLHTGATEEARQDLRKVFDGESLFRWEAAFYMALSYAQKGDKMTARSWLDKIPAGAPVADRAAGLRKKLE
jgi:tetratricopeptide (TPR) repeat protein